MNDLRDFFALHPVFTRGEFAAATENPNQRTVDSMLRYHVARRHIVRVRRMLYAAVPPGADAGTFQPDPFLTASRASPTAVIAYHSALEFHGLAYASHPGRVIAACAEAVRSFEFRGREFRLVRPPRSLLRVSLWSDEVLTTSRAGLPLKVTSPERSIVDVLDRPELGDGLASTWVAISSLGSIRMAGIVDYAERLGHRATAGLVGLLLSQQPPEAGVTRAHLDRLMTLAPRRPIYVGGREAAKLAKPWNVMVPALLLDRPRESDS